MKSTLLVCLSTIVISSKAQEYHRTFQFKVGDEYQTEMLVNSSAILTRGKQTLNINSTTAATKTYKVTGATAANYNLSVEINKMKLDLDALGKVLTYDSSTGFDSTSTILKALDFMLKKPVSVTVDKHGIIQSSTDYKAELATDTLVSFAGLQPETFEKQTLLNLLADITYNAKLAKDFTWTDSVQIDKQKLKTTFTIAEITENNTIVKFSSSIVGKLVSSNSNGTYVIENKTGLILEKYLYSKSVGYMISAGNVVYAVSRSSNVTEKTKKVR